MDPRAFHAHLSELHFKPDIPVHDRRFVFMAARSSRCRGARSR